MYVLGQLVNAPLVTQELTPYLLISPQDSLYSDRAGLS